MLQIYEAQLLDNQSAPQLFARSCLKTAEKLENFKAFVKKQVDDNEMTKNHINNIAEISLTFNILMGRTVA